MIIVYNHQVSVVDMRLSLLSVFTAVYIIMFVMSVNVLTAVERPVCECVFTRSIRSAFGFR